MVLVCEIYKSKKDEELYLYIDKDKGLDDVPEALKEKINCEKPILTLPLTPERKLARADIQTVLSDLETKGFYLQLPPTDFPNPEEQ